MISRSLGNLLLIILFYTQDDATAQISSDSSLNLHYDKIFSRDKPKHFQIKQDSYDN
jgi:hypothetical protein